MAQWKCTVCGYIYDESIGDLKGGIPKETPFEKLPDTWTCPVCREILRLCAGQNMAERLSLFRFVLKDITDIAR